MKKEDKKTVAKKSASKNDSLNGYKYKALIDMRHSSNGNGSKMFYRALKSL